MVRASALWWGSLEGADLETLIACAGRAGFSEISTTPAMYFAAHERGRTDRELRTLLDAHGIAVTIIDPLLRGLPGACTPERVGRRWRSTFEHDEDDCHRVADALDATIVNIAHFLGAPTELDELVDAVGAIAGRAAARGRSIAVEAMPEGAIPDVRTAAAIVRGVDHRSCGLTVDTWHWWRSGGDLAELRDLDPGSIFALQLSDALNDARATTTAPPSRDRLLPGAGDVPLVEVVRVARANTPSVRVGLEVFDRTVGVRPFDESARAAAVSVEALEQRVADPTR